MAKLATVRSILLCLLISLTLPDISLPNVHKYVNFVIRAGSRRSTGCDHDQSPLESDAECVCLGTENGRNLITVQNRMGHYERLRKSYIRCRRIMGNLELTHVGQGDVDRDNKALQLNASLSSKGSKSKTKSDYRRKRPFWFLEHVEEITGYLLIYNVNVAEFTLPNLRIIWGERLHDDSNALQIESCPGLRVLNMPSLRTIDYGNLTIKSSPNLCYMERNRDFVRYEEIFSKSIHERLHFNGTFDRSCARAKLCHKQCNSACFGPGPDQCQIVYRRDCIRCESGCFWDKKDKVHKCCDGSCAGGCIDEGANKCTACQKFEQEGRCVSECRGIERYNPTEKRMEPLPDAQKSYAYGRHCVPKCPPGSLSEGGHCVSRCSLGKYRNGTDHCIPCPNGECPKVCQVDEPIDSESIEQLVNCTEIEGNIELLSHVFEEHLPLSATIPFNSTDMQLPPLRAALKASQLEVLRSVQIVTGYVLLDGGNRSSKDSNRPTSLEFLSGLEMIEGRQLYAEKFALYVIGNPELTRLGLRSLNRIKIGLVGVTKNRQLCYSYTIPFRKLYGVRETVWSQNMDKQKCEANNRVCSPTCAPEFGCWGMESRDCLRCRNFTMEDRVCTDQCQTTNGQYIVNSTTNTPSCLRCHEQCLECFGPSANQCSMCRNFELWFRDRPGPGPDPFVSVSDGPSSAAVRQCVAKCPNMTYPEGTRCEPCHQACRGGCTGPETRVGMGGCNQCHFALEGERIGELTCLVGDEPEKAVCGERNGLNHNYFITLAAPSSAITKYLCRKCRPECSSCMGDGVHIRGQSVCQCAFYQMALYDQDPSEPTECAMDCAKGSRMIVPRNESHQVGLCQQCHPLCDPHFSCIGPGPSECDRCSVGGVMDSQNGTILCLAECPPELPHVHEGLCYEQDVEQLRGQRIRRYIGLAVAVLLVFAFVISFLVYRCVSYQKKYAKEVQMHLPEIPPLDPMKVTQRPNMRRINLIQIDELDFAPEKRAVLGQGAFGIVYAGKWKPPNFNQYIPVAIKAITESRYINEKEMLHEAGLMHSVRHEHLLPVAGICMGGDGLKIVTLLRPLGSLLKFLQDNAKHLWSKHLMLYCFQISSAMEYLAKKRIVHRDLAARNVLVRNVFHVEVTDFGLAAMLQQPGDSVVIDGRVAIKWLALESLRRQVYNQKTDVWSFGVTCWEILAFGESPYKDLQLKREKLASELAYELERGYRLRQPANCSQELYKELLNCWLMDPNSRPNFGQIKCLFEEFCRAPHIYIQDRQATQHLNNPNSLVSTDQRAMIERLLRDNDFLDPVNLEPAEYIRTSRPGSRAMPCSPNPNTLSTDCFFSASPPSPRHDGGPPLQINGTMSSCLTETTRRLGSTCTASTRYKSDPVGRKHSQWSQSEETDSGRAEEFEDEEELEGQEGGGDDEEVLYLMPRRMEPGEASRNNSSNNRASEMYTPVVEGEGLAANYANHDAVQTQRNEYANDKKETVKDLILLTPGYANTMTRESAM